MDVKTFDIPGVCLITPRRHGDARGFFEETFNARLWAERAGIAESFVQDNFSFSAQRGTVRALHCQAPPFVQGKLVRCTRGSVFDVAVDARKGSPTYGRHVGAVLSRENGAQLWVPGGFLHGFVTLEPDTEFVYKVTGYYDRASERPVLWNDPDLAIDWPISESEAVLKQEDANAPRFGDWDSPFVYKG